MTGVVTFGVIVLLLALMSAYALGYRSAKRFAREMVLQRGTKPLAGYYRVRATIESPDTKEARRDWIAAHREALSGVISDIDGIPQEWAEDEIVERHETVIEWDMT